MWGFFIIIIIFLVPIGSYSFALEQCGTEFLFGCFFTSSLNKLRAHCTHTKHTTEYLKRDLIIRKENS